METNCKSLNHFSLVVLLSLLFGCTHEPSKVQANKVFIKAAEFKNTTSWTDTNYPDSSETKKIKLIVLNNPYKFNSNNKIIVYLSQEVIYKGEFETHVDVYVKIKSFGKNLLPGVQIFQGDTEYNFIHKSSIFLSPTTKFLYIVFLPENDLSQSCYLFGQDEAL